MKKSCFDRLTTLVRGTRSWEVEEAEGQVGGGLIVIIVKVAINPTKPGLF